MTAAQLTYDRHADDIRQCTTGVVGVRAIDWQNRATFPQVVAFTGHRTRDCIESRQTDQFRVARRSTS